MGFLVGKVQVKGFSLGVVTSVLLVGVLIGQLNIPTPGPLKQVAFLIFLFAIGYKVGPKFFAGSAWILARLAPKLLGGVDKLKVKCRELEKQMGNDDSEILISRGVRENELLLLRDLIA